MIVPTHNLTVLLLCWKPLDGCWRLPSQSHSSLTRCERCPPVWSHPCVFQVNNLPGSHRTVLFQSCILGNFQSLANQDNGMGLTSASSLQPSAHPRLLWAISFLIFCGLRMVFLSPSIKSSLHLIPPGMVVGTISKGRR